MNLKATIIWALLCALTAVCRAQAPTPTPSVNPSPSCTPFANLSNNIGTPFNEPNRGPTPDPLNTPTPTPIPDIYQAPDGHKLKWRVYQPTDGQTKWPVVLILHEGGYKTGSFYDHLDE